MFNLISIIIFLIIAIFSVVINTIIFYHFKKFNLPDDEREEKILNNFKIASITLFSFMFLFLILILVYN